MYNISDPIEREKELIRRLHEFGETWEGEYPTLNEVWFLSKVVIRFTWLTYQQNELKKIRRRNCKRLEKVGGRRREEERREF